VRGTYDFAGHAVSAANLLCEPVARNRRIVCNAFAYFEMGRIKPNVPVLADGIMLRGQATGEERVVVSL
jgi:hypothetical protein